MRVFRIAACFLVAISVSALFSFHILSKDIVSNGLFLLETSSDFIFSEKSLEKFGKLYPDMHIDDSMLDNGIIMVTVLPYKIIASYRRIEQATQILGLQDTSYKLYEAGLIPQSIEEKARIALWGIFIYLSVYFICILINFLNRRIEMSAKILNNMYWDEFVYKRWKWILCSLAFPIGYIVIVIITSDALSFPPLLPITPSDTIGQLWKGLVGNELLTDISTLEENEMLSMLWNLNNASNISMSVFFIALIFLFIATYKHLLRLCSRSKIF